MKSAPVPLRFASQPGLSAALVMVAPRRATGMLLGRLAPLFLAQDRRLFVVDGANSFDPYRFSGEARRRGLRDDVLDRVFVTRAFTIHQLAAATGDMLPHLLRESPTPAIAVLGLDHLFLEESLRAAERARVLSAVIGGLDAVRQGGARLLVTHERPPEGQAWWRPMLEFGDIRGHVLAEGKDGWKLQIGRCNDGAYAADIQYLASGGDRIVEGVPPGAEG